MKRKMHRALIKARFRLCKLHKRVGRWQELSHLTYFSVLAMESKYMYAKVGLACIVLSVLYMISEED